MPASNVQRPVVTQPADPAARPVTVPDLAHRHITAASSSCRSRPCRRSSRSRFLAYKFITVPGLTVTPCRNSDCRRPKTGEHQNLSPSQKWCATAGVGGHSSGSVRQSASLALSGAWRSICTTATRAAIPARPGRNLRRVRASAPLSACRRDSSRQPGSRREQGARQARPGQEAPGRPGRARRPGLPTGPVGHAQGDVREGPVPAALPAAPAHSLGVSSATHILQPNAHNCISPAICTYHLHISIAFCMLEG